MEQRDSLAKMAAVTEALAQDKCSLNHLVLQVRPGPRGMDLPRVPLPRAAVSPGSNPRPPGLRAPFRPSSLPTASTLDLGARVRVWVCTRTPPSSLPAPPRQLEQERDELQGAAADAGAGQAGTSGAAGEAERQVELPRAERRGLRGLRAAGGAAGAAGGSGSRLRGENGPSCRSRWAM